MKDFFDRQLTAWPECARRYSELGQSLRKTLVVDGREYRLTHNPARIRSATARVLDGRVERPCFLCRRNRPPEQQDIRLDTGSNAYMLSVNPYPILPEHFTIISERHCRQELNAVRLADMAFVARHMEGFLVFFNGACSGASAPDHFHFQAVPQSLVPLLTWDKAAQQRLGVRACETEDVKIDFRESDHCNVICWFAEDSLHWWVIRRKRHRPWQYAAEGTEKLLISPAALEFAGIVPLAREEDYERIDATLLADVLGQCWEREPLVDVGIGPDTATAESADGVTTLRNVAIGIGFHWEQKRDLTVEGTIIRKLNAENGQSWLVNRLPVEAYLKSVIASEMSPDSSLELLKAHAVISRSWLLRQCATHNGQSLSPKSSPATPDLIRWYDSHSHLSFDVCADDHCQRYQGIGGKVSPNVLRAMEETRGEVLMFGTEVCDARFSKCCGGKTEEYRYCWEDKQVDYLRSVPDTREDGSAYCDTKDTGLLRQILNDYDQQTRDFYEWEVSYSQEELSELVERKLRLGLGKILALEPVERGKSGRISLLRIVGENRSVVIGKELEIRKALSPTHLYSSRFDVTADNGTFTLHGHGWGHGVGLCQIGAAAMAAEGFNYKQILSHYYVGVEIKKIW